MITWLVEIRIFLILDNYSYYYNRNAITYHSVGISIYERGGGDEKGVKSEKERERGGGAKSTDRCRLLKYPSKSAGGYRLVGCISHSLVGALLIVE